MQKSMPSQSMGKKLILDELHDLFLYEKLLDCVDENTKALLTQLIPIEKKHVAFWQNIFDLPIDSLNAWRKVKLWINLMICKIFGAAGVHIVLESLEVYGIRKYLDLWHDYKDTEFGDAVKEILHDEIKHEESIVSQQVERKINSNRIRDLFFGFNDGLVELLGAVSGFYASFDNSVTVIIAASSVAVAGAISMASGAYVASGSQAEVEKIENAKQLFLGKSHLSAINEKHPIRSGIVTGISYIIGAIIPILPIFFGAQNIFASVIASVIMIIALSYLVAIITGMDIKKRILTNLLMIAGAVGITYLIGTLVSMFIGVVI